MLEILKDKKSFKAFAALCVLSIFFSTNQLSNTVLAYIMNSYSELGSTAVQQIMTLPGLIGLVVSFIIGPIALKFSKKKLLIICSSSMLVYFLIFLFVGSKGPFAALLIAACFAGITNGSTMALVGSEVAIFFNESKRATITAMTIAFQNIGLAILSSVGGVIAAENGGANWSKAYALGLLIIPAIIVFAVLMPADTPETATQKGGDAAEQIENSKKEIPFIVFIFVFVQAIFCICLCAFLYNYSTYIIMEHGLGSSVQAGFTFTCYTVVSVVVSMTYVLWDKIFKKWIGTAGYVIFAIGLLLMATITSNLAGAYVGSMLVGFGFSISNPYIMAKVMGEVSPRMVPVSMSIFVGAVMISMCLAPYVLNFFGRLVGGSVDALLNVGAAGGIICAISSLFLYVFRDTKKAKV